MYNPMEINRIDRQIEDLQRLKASYQNMPQPINNIINPPATVTQTAPAQPLFEARFTTENPADIYVTNKTAFIDLKNGKLSIKETDGDLKEYVLVLPKDEKDLKIESLERKLKEMEARINSYSMGTFNNIGNMGNINNTEPMVNNINTTIPNPINMEQTPNVPVDTYTNPSTPIVVDNYNVVEDTKHKKSFVDKLKFKN